MATLFKTGFEEGVIPPELLTQVSEGNTIEVVNVNPRSGTYSCHVNCPIGQRAMLALDLVPQSTIFVDLPIFLAKPLDGGVEVISLIYATVGWVKVASVALRREDTGIMLQLTEGYPIEKVISVPVTLELGAYHSIQLGFDKVTGKYSLYLDYTLIASDIQDLTGAPDVNLVLVGNYWASGTPEFYIDDLTIATEEVPGVPIAPVTYTLTIPPTVGGTTDPPPATYTYDAGTVVTVTAYADTGQYFQQWTLDGVIHRENPIKVIMNSNYTLTPSFAETPPPTHCFIATACLRHTAFEHDIGALRLLRDKALPSWFVTLYYLISPPIAQWIEKSEVKRKVVRKLIMPFVRWAKRLYGWEK